MGKKKGYFKQFTDVANLIAIIALLLTAWQMRKGNYVQIESNVNMEVGYTMEMLLPCWEQWKELYFESQKLSTFETDFLSKASIARDRWNVTLSALNITEGNIPKNTIDEIFDLMKSEKYKEIENKINQILVNNIDKVMSDFRTQIKKKRERIKNRII